MPFCLLRTIRRTIAVCRTALQKPRRAELRVRTTLIQNFSAAAARVDTALGAFQRAMSELPKGTLQPDQTKRIQECSRELWAARSELMRTESCLKEFLSRGSVPVDMKEEHPDNPKAKQAKAGKP
jgi:hypothetical protein